MLLQPKDSTNPKDQFHVPSGIGKALILTGVVTEVVPPAKTALPTVWNARFLDIDCQYPPVIHYKCPNCGNSGHQESKRGTAHETARFGHCGRVEVTPDAIAEKYLTLWKQYAARTRRR